MRQKIRQEISQVRPLDDLEEHTIAEVIRWIDSGDELFRIQKPDKPPKHLVSYFALVDGEFILLVDHINAELWLPTGGHIEPDEHPKDAALREAKEELNVDAQFLLEYPLLVTSTETVGRTAGHIDVSIWYALRGDRQSHIAFDRSEFHSIRWFHREEIPWGRTDPHMSRFLRKLYGSQ